MADLSSSNGGGPRCLNPNLSTTGEPGLRQDVHAGSVPALRTSDVPARRPDAQGVKTSRTPPRLPPQSSSAKARPPAEPPFTKALAAAAFAYALLVFTARNVRGALLRNRLRDRW